jgi:hypothetical protein
MDVTAPTTEQNLLRVFGRGRYVRQETLIYLKIDHIYEVKLKVKEQKLHISQYMKATIIEP